MSGICYQPHEQQHVQKFAELVDVVQRKWPPGCADNPEWDVLLRAAKEAFRPGTQVHTALEVLYVRQGMLRPLVDMLAGCFTEQFCNKYKA